MVYVIRATRIPRQNDLLVGKAIKLNGSKLACARF